MPQTNGGEYLHTISEKSVEETIKSKIMTIKLFTTCSDKKFDKSDYEIGSD